MLSDEEIRMLPDPAENFEDLEKTYAIQTLFKI